MIYHRKSQERGYYDHGWLRSFHTFSFADYYDPNFMGFGPLRVINEDFIQGGTGFPTHGHRDMEIITYVISGAIEHKDSTGSHGVIHPGEIQQMTAGRGIRHSEFNYYKDKETHLLQIWIEPDQRNHEPGYIQQDFTQQLKTGKHVLIASPDKSENSLLIHQDVKLFAKKFHENEIWSIANTQNRLYWMQVVHGQGIINNLNVFQGDGIAISAEKKIDIQGTDGFEILLFDMKK